jgi:hypothetical protein
MVASRPKVPFNQTTAQVPEIMDTTSYQLCRKGRLSPEDRQQRHTKLWQYSHYPQSDPTKIWTSISILTMYE